MENYVFYLDNGETIPVHFIKNRAGRNIVLRPILIPEWSIRVSVPRGASQKNVLSFIEEKSEWLKNFFSKQEHKIKVQEGIEIEFLGQKLSIKNDKTGRYGVCIKEGDIWVCGTEEMMEHRVRDFLKKEFLKYIKDEVKKINEKYPNKPSRITLRDTRSRWGSCSSDGNLSFSWRLCFAPESVIRYVIIHELSHLEYMDHSEQFWNLVRKLNGLGVERAKIWLSKNGTKLQALF